MTRAQKIWTEREELFKAINNNDIDSFLLYHKACDLYEEHKFDPAFVKIELFSSIDGGEVCISAPGSETTYTKVRYSLNTLQRFLDRFNAEEHYKGCWVTDEYLWAGTTLERAIATNATKVLVFIGVDCILGM